jgi:CheY-like chemotaxis protein
MPRLDGIEATKEIRRFNKDVTIIAMTNSAQESVIAKFKEVGFDAYIVMPYTEEDILNVIFRLMH